MLSDLAKREVIKSSQSATLHIGMTPSTVSMMSDHLLHFAKKYPKVRFDVHEGSTFTLKRPAGKPDHRPYYSADSHCIERM